MTIIQTHALTRRFDTIAAVDRFTISVVAGEVFGLLGPNGAGKTTVIKMLTTLLPPTSGSASVAGFDIVRQPGEVRRVIGYVPQMLSADGAGVGQSAFGRRPWPGPSPSRLPYEVDGLRALMLSGGASSLGLGLDFTVLLLTAAIAVVLGGQLYPSVVI